MTPLDPNHKDCLNGIGPINHVAEGTGLSYKVEFENMEEATAPAQIVTILDPLSEELDWSTFEFTEIGFGDTVIPLEPGSTIVDEVMEFGYTDEDYDIDMELHINGEIDTTRGEIFMIFQSFDPDTGLPPGVDTGFLPPEDGTGRGQGYFMYNIDPVLDLPSGTGIRNIATIQFNLGMEIDTNQIDPLDSSKGTSPDLEALVTIDAGPPSSSVEDLSDYVNETYQVSWSGQDEAGGSGISEYDIYFKDDEGPWTLWMEGTNLTFAQFNGTLNHTYSFYSVATDLVGHREEKDPSPETITTVKEFTAPVANAGPDQRVDEGTMVTFDGSGSSDGSGIVNYTWAFNDGIEDVAIYGIEPGHLFTVPGQYSITLNVTNGAGYWDRDSMRLTVDEVKDGDDDDDDDEDGRFPYLLTITVLVIIPVFTIVLLLIFVIVIRSRKGFPDEE